MSLLNLAAYKPVPGTLGDANAIANAMTATETAVNGLDDTNWTGTGAAGLALTKLKNYPADGSKFASGDGTWKSASAVVATTVAGLGAGFAGAVGLLRLPPTTNNAGGATALPAATLTVGDTAEFPAAGTLTTPNGVVTYTGKTATTFTGCTGGTGTLAANAVITLATGAPVGSYDVVLVTYDSTIGKWIAREQLLYSGLGNTVLGGAAMTTLANANGVAGDGQWFQWRKMDAAGLTPQFRVDANVGVDRAATVQYQLAFQSLPLGLAPAATVIGADVATLSRAYVAGGSTRIQWSSPWANIPAYTLADLVGPCIQWTSSVAANLNAGNAVLYRWRWVG